MTSLLVGGKDYLPAETDDGKYRIKCQQETGFPVLSELPSSSFTLSVQLAKL
jgi:hypothetical protein